MAGKTIIETKKYIATYEEVKKIEEQLIECGKNNKPYENIICPKCGGNIIFKEIGNSYTVKCETPDCISYGVRGL